MRPERNPLDLNNLPDDYTRDGKQIYDQESCSTGYRKKKSGGKDGKDECGKVYECRFCSLKFCKSQALGGHMNRHRQERETETLNRARQLVFSNDNLAAQAASHLGGQPITHGAFHQTGGDPTLSFRSIYSPRLFPAAGSSSNILQPPPPPPPQPYLYPSPSRLVSYPPSQYPPHPVNEYYVGHVLGNTSNSVSQYGHHNPTYMGAPESNYTCIGAPVGPGFATGNGSGRSSDMGAISGGRDGSLQKQRLDHPSPINRFQDGF